MTKAAERVAAFCERVITYETEYKKYRREELGAWDDAKADGVQPGEISQSITEDKRVYCQLLPRARWQVMELIQASVLTPKQRRIMELRYNRAKTWRYITKVVGFKNKHSTYRERRRALELMAPALDKLYPNWKIGDE